MKEEKTFLQRMLILGWKYNNDTFRWELFSGKEKVFSINAELIDTTKPKEMLELFNEIYRKAGWLDSERENCLRYLAGK